MPFTQSQKTKSHEPLQRSCSSPVGASAGRKTKRASAPMIAQIMVIIFDFIIWKFIVWKFTDAGLVLHPLKIEMPVIPLGRWNSSIFLHKIIIHIVCVCTCQNVGSGVVRCVSFPVASLVACDFFVNVCSHCFVYLLFSIAKVSIKIEYPNKFLLFIKNLCFCSLKISGASKNSDREKETKNPYPSKNYGVI